MMHWDHPCVVDSSTFDATWARAVPEPVLFVMGIGFDVRACLALERLLGVTERRVDLLLLELPVDSTDLSVRPLVDANVATARRMVEDAGGTVNQQELPPFSDEGSLGRLVSRAFHSSTWLESYVEIIVEVSAMPRSVYFPLIRGILARAHTEAHHAQHWPGDLHVVACEHPGIDSTVVEEGTKPTAPIGGFGSPSRQRPETVIWVPVLGENAGPRIEQLYLGLAPDETCPVLPWPSRDPRRSDRLVLEMKDLLFQTIRLEPRNIIHASEHNPFDLYRTIGELHSRYTQALAPLGSVGMVLSSHSSKLLSIGVLLAAYDFGLEVQHVSPGTYSVVGDGSRLLNEAELFDLWLTGIPYQVGEI